MNELDICNIRLADFIDSFNKTRQGASDVILQGGRSYRYSDASQKKITSDLAEVIFIFFSGVLEWFTCPDGPLAYQLR